MEFQTVVLAIIGSLLALSNSVTVAVWHKAHTNKVELLEFKAHVAYHYAHKKDLAAMLERIDSRLDKLTNFIMEGDK